jgi:two-component system LytT family response regulator
MLELIDSPPAVIFTTAFDQYAVKAFDAVAIDYLLKPFSQERFSKAIEKFLAQANEPQLEEREGLNQLAEKSNRLVVRVKNEIKIIPIHEVTYFEAEDDYISIHTAGGKYLKKMTMKSLEDAMDPGKFARVHRSFMVNLNQITQIEPFERDSYILKMRDGNQVPVSKTGYSRLRLVPGL